MVVVMTLVTMMMLTTTKLVVQGCIKARGGCLRRAKPNWSEPDLGQPPAAAGPPLVHYETFQNHETVNSLHLPCPPTSSTASLLWTEPHEHWAVECTGSGS